MEELEQILREHSLRYPEMMPQDAVKLLYQNEFGGGHMIRNEAVALEYLRREYVSVPRDAEVPRQESIGNGVVRVNLASLSESELPWLWDRFLSSAAARRGTVESFLNKLEVLRRVTEAGYFGFDSAALETYLRDYEKAGYPMVSHSDRYRQAYAPAYRIVLK